MICAIKSSFTFCIIFILFICSGGWADWLAAPADWCCLSSKCIALRTAGIFFNAHLFNLKMKFVFLDILVVISIYRFIQMESDPIARWSRRDHFR